MIADLRLPHSRRGGSAELSGNVSRGCVDAFAICAWRKCVLRSRPVFLGFARVNSPFNPPALTFPDTVCLAGFLNKKAMRKCGHLKAA